MVDGPGCDSNAHLRGETPLCSFTPPALRWNNAACSQRSTGVAAKTAKDYCHRPLEVCLATHRQIPKTRYHPTRTARCLEVTLASRCDAQIPAARSGAAKIRLPITTATTLTTTFTATTVGKLRVGSSISFITSSWAHPGGSTIRHQAPETMQRCRRNDCLGLAQQ